MVFLRDALALGRLLAGEASKSPQAKPGLKWQRSGGTGSIGWVDFLKSDNYLPHPIIPTFDHAKCKADLDKCKIGGGVVAFSVEA